MGTLQKLGWLFYIFQLHASSVQQRLNLSTLKDCSVTGGDLKICFWFDFKKKESEKIFLIPAVDALVNITVWNHIGKKYMIEKLQIETRKLDVPTKMGIFCLRRDGARTGSGAMKNSTITNRIANMHARVIDMITAGFDHWIRVSYWLDMLPVRKVTCRKTFVVTNAQKYQSCTNLKPEWDWTSIEIKVHKHVPTA